MQKVLNMSLPFIYMVIRTDTKVTKPPKFVIWPCNTWFSSPVKTCRWGISGGLLFAVKENDKEPIRSHRTLVTL